jgi:AraC-like DNA-binding protein
VSTAPSVRAGLETFVRYSALLSDAFTWQLDIGARSVQLHWHCRMPIDVGASIALETSLAQVVVGMRQLAGSEVDPLRVSFAHAAPAHIREHRALFRCRIDWNADVYRVVFARHVLDATPPQANAKLWQYLCGQAEQAAQQLAPQPLSVRVEAEITRELSEARAPQLEPVARRLGLSERSLRRQLAAESLNFRSLVDRARRDRVRVLLKQANLPIGRVAYEVGFADASALAHACQRWFARSPRDLV